MDAYIGEVRAFGYQFAPQGWLECNGLTYPVQQFQALAALLGANYGGDGRTTFGVPNLMGQAVVGAGQGPGLSLWTLAHKAGTENVTLTSINQLPLHNHTVVTELVGTNVQANTSAAPVANSSWLSHPVQVVTGTSSPTAGVFNFVAGAQSNTNLAATTVGLTGPTTVAAHENRQPYLPMIYCICWEGVFPSPAN